MRDMMAGRRRGVMRERARRSSELTETRPAPPPMMPAFITRLKTRNCPLGPLRTPGRAPPGILLPCRVLRLSNPRLGLGGKKACCGHASGLAHPYDGSGDQE